jgi:hypothetical protein
VEVLIVILAMLLATDDVTVAEPGAVARLPVEILVN